MEDGETSVEVPLGFMVEAEEDEKEDRRRMDNLVARVQKLEEQVRGMHQKMWEAMSFTEAVTEEENASWGQRRTRESRRDKSSDGETVGTGGGGDDDETWFRGGEGTGVKERELRERK